VNAAALKDPLLWSQLEDIVYSATDLDVRRALGSDTCGLREHAALLSPAATPYLEQMATRAQHITRQRFGSTVVLYVPLYVSNACTNHCTYCGFSIERSLHRRTLDLDEVSTELKGLKAQHFEHVLVLTGEDKRVVPVSYLRDVVALCHRHCASVAIEVYPLDAKGYAQLVEAGCDGLTLYQETYNQEVYAQVHPKGPKAHFGRRLDAPALAAGVGMRSVGIGALLGLADWRVEGVCMGIHGRDLRKRFWRSRLSIGFPRLRVEPAPGITLKAPSEAQLAQLIFANRIAFPDADLVLSTRERQLFRDGMIGLGITRMSAGSRTRPGGYTLDDDAGEQFAIVDARSPAEIADVIVARGCEPVWKDFAQEFTP
jgi:2-iminoacetate synthase